MTVSNLQPLVDSFGRVHTSVRISITDRCNIRCFYCMPEGPIRFLPRSELLSYEEMARFARVLARMGVDKVRITGGEPLVRNDVHVLVQQLAGIPQIVDIALTTNGILLAERAQRLKDAGLKRINISLDGLSEATFRSISRREGLQRVLDGIAAAERAGLEKIRLNAVAIRGLSEPEIVPLGRFARERGLPVRFIEFMPLDAQDQWCSEQVLTGDEIRATLQHAFGALIPVAGRDPSQPSADYMFADGRGEIGFINTVSQPFCHACNRLRITAEGKMRNCLFSDEEWDVRALLRNGSSDRQIAALARQCVAAKKPGHGIDQPDFMRPTRAMYQIGG